MPMPEEMAELIRQDPEGDILFHTLSPGKQRSLLYMIGKPKSTDIRLRKAILVMEYLKYCGAKFDQKEMAEFMKRNR